MGQTIPFGFLNVRLINVHVRGIDERNVIVLIKESGVHTIFSSSNVALRKHRNITKTDSFRNTRL